MDKIIGKNIKKARNEIPSINSDSKGVSQLLVAELLGYKSSVPVSLIEDGKRKISVENLHKISIAFDKPMEWFLKDEADEINCRICSDTRFMLCNGKNMRCVFCEAEQNV